MNIIDTIAQIIPNILICILIFVFIYWILSNLNFRLTIGEDWVRESDEPETVVFKEFEDRVMVTYDLVMLIELLKEHRDMNQDEFSTEEDDGMIYLKGVIEARIDFINRKPL